MNFRLFAAVAAASLSTTAWSAYGDTEYKIRALSVQQDVATGELYAHAADGSATAGRIQLKGYLNHEFDTLQLKSLKLVITSKTDPASAKDPAEVIGSCELPAKKGGSAILLFTREAPGKATCKITVVDDSAKAVPKGSVWVANFTTMPIRIELEKKPFDFKPGEIKLITDPPVGPSNSSAMKGTYQFDGQWKNFASGVWPHPGSKRRFHVLTEAEGGQIESRGVIDVVTR